MNRIYYTMKSPLTLVATSFLFLAGCAGLGSMEKEIEALNELLDIMTIYIASQVIPPFKSKKVAIYEKIV